MCTSHAAGQEAPQAAAGRRAFLRATALAGAATAIGGIGTAAAQPAAAAGSAAAGWRPDPDSSRFTLAVMPDTQHLLDGPSLHREPVEASLRYLLDHQRDENIVFLCHLGDITQNGTEAEFAAAGQAFGLLDEAGAGYSMLAGNHDVRSRTDDQRGPTPYLATFGPERAGRLPTFGGASPDGYNTFHLFRAGGREWLLLALDWRLSDAGFAWARKVLADHPEAPVILTTHELLAPGEKDPGSGELSEYGQRLWDELIAGHDQIFLTLNGHFWPTARTVRRNHADNDVHLHLTNYQNRYYGGSAMIRLYRFDLARDTIDVETVSPWILGRAGEGLNALERQEIELTGPDDRFSVPLDFAARFAGFAPVPARPARPAAELVTAATLAYWRFDGGRDGTAVPDTARVKDLTGRGNDLVKVTVPGSSARALTYSAAHHPDQPAHGSLRFDGSKPPLQGAYLRTVDGAPLNAADLRDGYTVEAFYRLPTDWDPSRNAWSALLGRRGTGGAAGKADGDPDEPLATLSISNDREAQWAVRPLDQQGISTNWSHETPLDTWWHLAVVNDGTRTVMYVEGCPVAANPTAPARGLTTLGLSWLLGGYEYGGAVDQVFQGHLGDVRITDGPLPVSAFMNR
ncbi:LamG-like jellyroll fold domain-containing protein [Streptomyces sp. NPDC051940]|uniref:LamG-like jellyroll fold domain-containing protein n=1 Tax=Streptomyces sp. NPDC051940 TaxID=3155675 RepID=UPI0034159C56